MEESDNNLSAEDNICEKGSTEKSKPKKRSLVERELETNLTARVTSPITSGEASSTSRYGRARRFKNDKNEGDMYETAKTIINRHKSPKPERSPKSPVQSPAYKMHASNSPIKIEMLEHNLDNHIENIYNENISLSRFGSTEKKCSPVKKYPKVYIRKDLIQTKDKDKDTEETVVLIKNMFSPVKTVSKSKSNNLVKSSEKHSPVNKRRLSNDYLETLSVVKTLDFDDKRIKIDTDKKISLSKSEMFDLEAHSEYQVGDLAWARMGTYPFWPCIVTREPLSGLFVKNKLFGRNIRNILHVTFFGDNGRRSWIVDTMLRPFIGQLEFETVRSQFTSETKKKDPKLYMAFFISEKKMPQWNISVEEAEMLLREPKRLRIDIFTNMLESTKSYKAVPKSDRSKKITRTDSDVSLSESLYDTLFSGDDTIINETDKTRTKKRNKSFDVSDVVTACLDNMAAKTGITKIQRQSHMDRWLLKAKTKTPEKSQLHSQIVQNIRKSSAKDQMNVNKVNISQGPCSFKGMKNEPREDDMLPYLTERDSIQKTNNSCEIPSKAMDGHEYNGSNICKKETKCNSLNSEILSNDSNIILSSACAVSKMNFLSEVSEIAACDGYTKTNDSFQVTMKDSMDTTQCDKDFINDKCDQHKLITSSSKVPIDDGSIQDNPEIIKVGNEVNVISNENMSNGNNNSLIDNNNVQRVQKNNENISRNKMTLRKSKINHTKSKIICTIYEEDNDKSVDTFDKSETKCYGLDKVIKDQEETSDLKNVSCNGVYNEINGSVAINTDTDQAADIILQKNFVKKSLVCNNDSSELNFDSKTYLESQIMFDKNSPINCNETSNSKYANYRKFQLSLNRFKPMATAAETEKLDIKTDAQNCAERHESESSSLVFLTAKNTECQRQKIQKKSNDLTSPVINYNCLQIKNISNNISSDSNIAENKIFMDRQDNTTEDNTKSEDNSLDNTRNKNIDTSVLCDHIIHISNQSSLTCPIIQESKIRENRDLQISPVTHYEKFNGDLTDTLKSKACDDKMSETKLSNTLICHEKQINTKQKSALTKKHLVVTNICSNFSHDLNRDTAANKNTNINDNNKEQQSEHQKENSNSKTKLTALDNTIIKNNDSKSMLIISEQSGSSIKDNSYIDKTNVEQNNEVKRDLDCEHSSLSENICEPIVDKKEIGSYLHKFQLFESNSKNNDECCQTILVKGANEKNILKHLKRNRFDRRKSEDIGSTNSKQTSSNMINKLLTTETTCNKGPSLKDDLTKKELKISVTGIKMLGSNNMDSKSQNSGSIISSRSNHTDNNILTSPKLLVENKSIENSNSESLIISQINESSIQKEDKYHNNKQLEQDDLVKKEISVLEILASNEKESFAQIPGAVLSTHIHMKDSNILENPLAETKVNILENKEKSNLNIKALEQNKFEDPEFQEYLESQIDLVNDEHPELSREEIESYLYKSWLYKQNITSNYKKTNEIDQTILDQSANDEDIPNRLNKKKSEDDKLTTADQASIVMVNEGSKTLSLEDDFTKEIKVNVPHFQIFNSNKKKSKTHNLGAVTTADKKCNNNIKKHILQPKNKIIEDSKQANQENTLIASENFELLIKNKKDNLNNMHIANHKCENPEFQKYLKSQVDFVKDEYRERSEEEIVSYLYQSWVYKQSMKSNSNKMEENDQTWLVKGTDKQVLNKSWGNNKLNVKMSDIAENSRNQSSIVNTKPLQENCNEAQSSRDNLELKISCSNSKNAKSDNKEVDDYQNDESLNLYPKPSFRLEDEIKKISDRNSTIVEHGDEKNNFIKNCSEQIKYKDPNFQRYLEFKQDSVIEDNPDLSQEEIISYLYKTWLYEETINFDNKKSDDYDQTNLIKGAKEKSYDKESNNRRVSRKRLDNINEISTRDIPIRIKDENKSEVNVISNYTKLANKCDTVVNNENHNHDDLEITSGSSKTDLELICDTDMHEIDNDKLIVDDNKDNASIVSEDSDISLNRRRQQWKDKALQNERKNVIEDLEFQRYVEMRQDSVMDEHPELSQDEIKAYLRKTWLYEEKFKTDIKRSDEVDQTSLVKGADQELIVKRVRKKNKVNKEEVEEHHFGCNEGVSPKEKSKRSIIRPYYNENLSDGDDEIGLFEIFRTKKKTNKSNFDDLENKVHVEEINLVQESNQTSSIIVEEEEEIDLVEMYFEQLTTRKPNLFKGLLREKVCEICQKIGNLIKCKTCHCMFHVDCDKNQINVPEEHTPNRGKKKKKRYRGRKPKNSEDTCLDLECHSDDKIQDPNSSDPNLSIENERVPLVFNADDFEAILSAKMKEILDNPDTLEYDFESDKVELHWSNAEPGKCEVIDIKLCAKSQEEIVDHSNFKCSNCEKYDVPICFVCKLSISPKDKVEYRQKCHVPQCYKYYHMECLNHWPQTQFNGGDSRHNKKNNGHFEALSCPRHVCHTCVSDDPRGCKTRFSSDKLARCVKCPATYHTFTKCLPAGSQVLTGSHIICPRHYEHRPGKVPCHVNTGWCFLCALGGTLICCEYCPTSFHAECLNIKPPEGGYMCEDCETGRLPLYGEMVWVKLGHYRWWPGIILHPSQIPQNIMAVKHTQGEFVVRFFGQYDHYWVNRGRVFPFQEGDTGKISNQKSKIDAAFSMAVEHASRACEILKNAVMDDEESQDIASSLLPPHYVKLKVNKPVGSLTARRPDLEESSLTQCECEPGDVEPCGPYSQCLNRMLLTECGPTCRAAETCNNRAFEKRLYPKMEPYRTPHRGWGLRTMETIRAGQFVIEYVGEILDETEFRRRMQRMHDVRDENFYFLTLDKERMIDAGPKGNLARFMNHSCEPNCETQKWTVLGDVRVGLFALYDIPANSELTFNYNLESAGIEKKRCMCGAKRCSGYIGAKPKQDDPQPKKNKPAAKKIPKKRKTIELSPTNRSKPKQRIGRPAKPKELTEIEKDLLIIKNATHAGSSDSETSGRLSSVDSKESRGAKRKRTGNSTNDLTLCLKRVKTSTGVEFRID